MTTKASLPSIDRRLQVRVPGEWTEVEIHLRVLELAVPLIERVLKADRNTDAA
jgi:hypothetical protein